MRSYSLKQDEDAIQSDIAESILQGVFGGKPLEISCISTQTFPVMGHFDDVRLTLLLVVADSPGQ